jgi:midasin
LTKSFQNFGQLPLSAYDFNIFKMAFRSAIHDPLAINLRGQTRVLISSLPLDSPHVSTLETAVSQTSAELLAVLSGLLSCAELTFLIATIYRPILLDLSARWLDEPQNTEDQLVALCYLLEVHEELFPCVSRCDPFLRRI